MAWVCRNHLQQTRHVVFGAFQPLKKDATAKDQKARDAKPWVVALGGCNDFFEGIFVHRLRRLTAIHQVVYRLIGLAFVVLHALSMRLILSPGAPFQIKEDR